jgi:hypothetical protein
VQRAHAHVLSDALSCWQAQLIAVEGTGWSSEQISRTTRLCGSASVATVLWLLLLNESRLCSRISHHDNGGALGSHLWHWTLWPRNRIHRHLRRRNTYLIAARRAADAGGCLLLTWSITGCPAAAATGGTTPCIVACCGGACGPTMPVCGGGPLGRCCRCPRAIIDAFIPIIACSATD